MSVDQRVGRENALAADMRTLQIRMQGLPALPSKASALLGDLTRICQGAVLCEALQNGSYWIKELVQLAPKPGRNSNVHTIVGGPKDFTRLVKTPVVTERLVRDDGAVVHFALTVAEQPGDQPLKLVSYGFEVYFPSKEPIEFIRFDLNYDGHNNDDLGLRSHLHPSHEQFQLPSPLLSPTEALRFCIYRCRPRRDVGRT